MSEIRTERTAEADGFFMPRRDQSALLKLLRKIPDLMMELGISETKQARLGKSFSGKKPRRPSEHPLPYYGKAMEASDNLHAVLVSWVKLVCEQRAMPFVPVGAVEASFIGPLKPKQWRIPEGYTATTPHLARWLDRHIISLAMTEGADTAYAEIRDAMEDATWIVHPPPERIIVDQVKVERARKLKLNASGIATLAKELGEEYRNLTARRVQVLKDAKVIRPAVCMSKQWEPDWPALFIVGQVLDAHLLYPIRKRHTTTAA